MSGRYFDVFFAALGILLCLPLFLIVGILIKLDSAGPVFFKQVRVGYAGRLFKIIKFRTMLNTATNDNSCITLGDESRVTGVGRFLRLSKIDELPQLINVLRGDMSLVGPRPEVPEYVKYYTQEQKRVFQLKPGITDFASIMFRNEALLLKKSHDPEKEYVRDILPEKLRLNLEYLEKKCLLLDVKLIFQTIIKTISP